MSITKGTKFYFVNKYGKFLRTITWVGELKFEWDSGYALNSKLLPNPNKKSRVKYIVNTLN
jgi:hypothetical protein